MRISTELIVEGNNYSEILLRATEHWNELNGYDSDLPHDTEIKVRNGSNEAIKGDKYIAYVTIRSKVDTNE